MLVTEEVKRLVNEKLKSCLQTANDRFNMEMAMPNVIYTKRGITAGTAHYDRHEINLNPTLLMQNVEDFLIRTVPHELAHLITGKIYPKTQGTLSQGRYLKKGRPHGNEWKQIMKLLGAESSRCHNYNVDTTRRSTSFEYICLTCNESLTIGPKRHKRNEIHHKANGIGLFAHIGCPKSTLVWKDRLTTIAAQKSKTKVSTKAKKSKKELAQIIYDMYIDTCTKNFILYKFQTKLNMSKAGANTYFYNASKN